MKKIIFFTLAVFCTLWITACGESPTDALKTYVDAMLEGDLEKANEYSYLDDKYGGPETRNEINATLIQILRENAQVRNEWSNLDLRKEVEINPQKVIVINTTLEGDEEIPMIKHGKKWKFDLLYILQAVSMSGQN